MPERKELKIEVKQLFKGKWKQAIMLSTIPIIISLFSVIHTIKTNYESGSIFSDSSFSNPISSTLDSSLIITIITVSVLIVLLFGLLISCIVNLFNQSTNFSFLDWLREKEMSHPVSKNITQAWGANYRSGVIGITIFTTIYLLFWTMLFIIPGIIKSLSYSQAYFIYKDQADKNLKAGLPKPKINDAITKSRKLMNGHKAEFFMLNLSFIGWAILVVLSASIGNIWYIPYVKATQANYYRYLLKDYNEIID